MAINILSKPQLTLPAAAGGIVLTAPGSAWGNSAYSELIASISGAAVLSGIVARSTFSFGFQAFDFEIDIATGAAASETRICTFRGGMQGASLGQSSAETPIYELPIGIDNIANNARVSARIRISDTTAFTCAVSAMYYAKPLTGATYLTTANPQLPIPSAAAYITLTASGTPWANGTYVQVRTNSGAALLLVSVVVSGGSGGDVYQEIDIATGAAASEVVITTLAYHGISGGPQWCLLQLPLDNIGLNVRIAARNRASGASATIRMSINVFEKPI